MRRIFYLVPLLLLTPAVALASAPKTFQELANVLVGLMNNAVVVLIVLGLVVYFYGVSTNILKFQKGGSANSDLIKSYFLWGVIVLFVMVSIWGILQILQNTLFGINEFNGNNTVIEGPGGSFTAPDSFQ